MSSGLKEEEKLVDWKVMLLVLLGELAGGFVYLHSDRVRTTLSAWGGEP